MSAENLTTYLNHHLGGSQAALQMLQRLAQNEPAADADFFAGLHAEVESDQRVLREIIGRLGEPESGLAKIAGGMAELAEWAKSGLLTGKRAALGPLESIEILVLGITGKLLLWKSLDIIRSEVPALHRYDFAELQRRAETQRDAVEVRRLTLARQVLGAED